MVVATSPSEQLQQQLLLHQHHQQPQQPLQLQESLRDLLEPHLLEAFKAIPAGSPDYRRLLTVFSAIKAAKSWPVGHLDLLSYLFENATDHSEIVFLLEISDRLGLFVSLRGDARIVFERELVLPFMSEHLDNTAIITYSLRLLKYRSLRTFCEHYQRTVELLDSVYERNRVALLLERLCVQA